MKPRHIFIAFALLAAASAALSAQESKDKVYLVSNAHLDTQWNWDVQTTIGDYIPKTMHMNFTHFEKYPWYTFNFEGGQIYAWMKEYYPSDYEMVKRYIKEGRWHVTGASWDANDPNMPSPESFSRNILYGQKFYEQEFGLRSTDIFLPDCFGFGWTLPSVAAHFGLIGFSTQKLEWRHKPFYENGRKMPFDIGLWQGIDGNQIMMAVNCKAYGQRWPVHNLKVDPAIAELVKLSGLNMAVRYFGTGDTGGAANLETMECIEYSMNQDGPLELISATSDQLFQEYLPFASHPELPVWDGELLMDVHATGCYSSQAAMKLFNRRNEQLADAAERGAVAADWLGMSYPGSVLETSWKRFIWHQFHDDLTGTSIPRAYEFSWNDEYISLRQFAQVMNQSVSAVAAQMETKTKGTPVVIYNPSAFPRTELLEVEVDGRMKTYYVTVPACGYLVYDSAKASKTSSVKASGKTLENNIYKLTLDNNGDIASIYDKRLKKELVADGKAIRLALFNNNKSTAWPAWEIIRSTMEATPDAITENVKVTASGSGSSKASLRVERTYKGSKFVQTISMVGGSDRIDIDAEIDWDLTGALLKAEFPLTCANPVARYDLGLGSVERDNNTDTKYEVYAHQWADMTAPDASYGVAVLNDCKYGWDKPSDDTFRLTLLHTPQPGRGYVYQKDQDKGHHIIRYAIVSHAGDFVNGNIPAKAEAFNQPLKVFTTTKHAGALGRSFSFASSDNAALAIRAIKKAEDGNGYIVRVYETAGKGEQKGNLCFAANVLTAYECDGNEDTISQIACSGKNVPVTAGKFAIKTYRVVLQSNETIKPVEYASIELPYSVKAATYNGFKREGNFDGRGNSIAAEQLPATLDYGQISFTLGNPALKNALLCRGQEITLPEGNWNKLYILACSTDGDLKVNMSAGDREQSIMVPYYSGFVGQWGHKNHTEGYVKDADIAWVGTHTHSAATNADRIYEYAYLFSIPVDIPQGAKTITLPKNQRIAVFAATVANEPVAQLAPAVDIMKIGIPAAEAAEGVEEFNLLAGKKVVDKSGEINAREVAEFAIDEDGQTKWCDISDGPRFITVDMGETKTILSWSVMHAGSEGFPYITSEFSLDLSNDGKEWKHVDQVRRNTDNLTDRVLKEPVEARYVRLNVIKGAQGGNDAARIYEFAVYGK